MRLQILFIQHGCFFLSYSTSTSATHKYKYTIVSMKDILCYLFFSNVIGVRARRLEVSDLLHAACSMCSVPPATACGPHVLLFPATECCCRLVPPRCHRMLPLSPAMPFALVYDSFVPFPFCLIVAATPPFTSAVITGV